MNPNDTSLLTVQNLGIAYPPRGGTLQWAVDGVSFAVGQGDRLGLVGESGCGKSTIGRALLQLLPRGSQVRGESTFQEKPILNLTGEALRHYRGEVMGLIFQDPMTRLDPLMTIGNHCLETLRCHSPELNKQEAKQKALETLKAVRIPADRWEQYPHEFSGGMRQRVAIALALLLDPTFIIADEPTTSLDVTVANEILQELTRLCTERNMGLLLISHDLAMVAEYCTEIAVMHQGKIVEMGNVQRIFKTPEHPYTRSLLEAALHLHSDKEFNPDIANKPLLSLKNLEQHYILESNFFQQIITGEKTKVIKAVDGINLDIYEGEILGLVGESGCGKSTLSRTILQLVPPTGGKVIFEGKELNRLSIADMRPQRRHLQMIFQDPHASLNPLMTVGENIGDPLHIHGLAQGEEIEKQVHTMLEKVGLTPTEEYYSRYPRQLSGGQQQRVGIARALITQPRLVICDEPVSMLDASIQAQVLDLMKDLKAEFNLTYLFITHDLWVAKFLCDRIAVMNQGKIVELGNTEELFKNPQHPYTQKLLGAAPLLQNI
ncbi:dipeptide ABC transporter ATP-binding protein [[Limnothrix rosea] IAM M-220]|uniref:dipeptide ABC transporter ATP-binding protein n=1 Tax=[Limnothrix rosea] IAM M-220 TaxID=454133 RepID=UPI00095CECC1|nr:ABC transporter ATP-binding protein [[Limnothrix rosea] IAM M-220]OKH17071.1 ABC transporter ATP-binding protein [[Limnothrix rosea] IAM M-220]